MNGKKPKNQGGNLLSSREIRLLKNIKRKKKKLKIKI